MGSEPALREMPGGRDDAALLARFAATLAAHHSATAGLEAWCRARGTGNLPRVSAQRISGRDAAEPAELRALLGASAETPLSYRHVALTCGDVPLSFAHIWFNPALLSAEMNAALATSDLPFGKVAAPLGYVREALPPPPHDWCPPDTVQVGRALLRLPDRRPLALVIECYTAAVLTAASS